MVKKKVSGQTIAIILLAILLLLTVAFGGVYAYYSSTTSKVSGKIKMANLNISMSTVIGETGSTSGSSEILISNGLFVPGQFLENSPLLITNKSNTTTYLAVVYKVLAYDDNGKAPEEYDDSKPLIDILKNDGYWYDYLYVAKDMNGNVVEDEDGNEVRYRCLVTTAEVARASKDSGDVITVIGEDCLGLSTSMGNGFQGMNISFTFQAFAIGSDIEEFKFAEGTTQDQKCEKIMQTIYKAFEYEFNI